MGEPRKIAETGQSRALFDPEGEGDTLIVTFTNRHWAGKGESDFWGHKFLSKRGFPALGIMGAAADWFPETETRALIEAVRATGALDGYRRIVTYGYSMGGYGAVKYASQLGAAASLSMSPQVSIDPKDVSAFDRRYRLHYAETLHPRMKVQPGDAAPVNYAVYDPRFAPDRRHVELLAEVAPVVPINAACSQHSSAMLLTESGAAEDLLRLVLDEEGDKQRRARAIVRRARRGSWTFHRRLGDYLLARGRTAQALAAFERSRDLRDAVGGAQNPYVLEKIAELSGAG